MIHYFVTSNSNYSSFLFEVLSYCFQLNEVINNSTFTGIQEPQRLLFGDKFINSLQGLTSVLYIKLTAGRYINI